MNKKFFLFDSNALKNFHKRIFFSITIFVFIYFIVFFRIVDVMILEKVINLDKNISQITKRGNIYDRNGLLLSSTINSHSLSVNPSNLKNKNILSEKLSSIISMPKKKMYDLFNQNSKFVWIKRNISPREHQNIIDLGEIGLRINKEKRRIYPYTNIPSHVVGYTDIDGKGLSGIERGLDESLNQGTDVYLSIDINLQQAVRKELLKIINKFSADSGIVIVVNIKNGEIISLNSLPDFDPNNKNTFKKNSLFNRAIQGNYEMGSMFKPLTIAMGIDKEIINSEMLFDVSKSIRGIEDFHPFNGFYGVKDIIVNSSNIGTAKIASIIGKKNQIEFFKKIGFNDKINFEIREAAVPLGNKNNWGKLETMTIGFGYGFAITPLHLVSAYASIINDGNKTNLTLLKNMTYYYDDTKIVKHHTSSYFIKLLRAVVLETKYTGPKVKIEGYEIGGKTGTTELRNEFGQYQKDVNTASFISVFPVSKPKYVVLAMIENPKKIAEENYSITGATVAAPLVKNIILRMIEILGISVPNSKEILKADTSINYQAINNATF